MMNNNPNAKKYWSNNEKLIAKSKGYFSQRYGERILRETNRVLGLSPFHSLDFGCGPGYFLDFLAAQGTFCTGADIVIGQGRKMLKSPKFRVPILDANKKPIPGIVSGSIQRIYLIEVIEHLTAANLKDVLQEIRRIADPVKGEIIVTTPNQERLTESNIRCPFCAQQFHRWQHVRSFDKESLPRTLKKFGWETVLCEEVNWDRPARTIKNFLRKMLFLEDRIKHKPHLFYAGKIRANHPKG
jgi:2-polyprenyl-3-methyl-5-hydroxy-6-metoxy-1,4-benzoquinol methylase